MFPMPYHSLVYMGVLLLVPPLLLFFTMLYRYIRVRVVLRNIPGPVPSFYLGNIKMLFDKNGERIPFPYVQKRLQEEYGDLVRFAIGGVPIVEIFDVQTMREVLASQFHAFRNRPYFITPLVGKRNASFREAMLFNSSPSWASVRAGSVPLFHSAALQSSEADVRRHMSAAADRIATAAAAADADAPSGGADGGGAIDVLRYVQQATLAVSFKVSFGTDMLPDGDDAGAPELADAPHPLAIATRLFFDSIQPSGGFALFAANLPPALRPLICRLSYLFSAQSAPLNRALDVIFAATQQMIEAYAAAHPELEVAAPPDRAILQRGFGRRVLADTAVPSEHSLIAHMLRCHNKASGQLFTPLEAMPQAWMMLVAGYETTAVATVQTLFCVAQHADAEAQLLREIDGHSADELPAHDTLDQWPFALACVKEAMRLFPLAFPVRIANKATKIAGQRVPAGTLVHVGTYAMQRDPRVWPHAEEFRPQRFLDGLSPAAEAAYQPFGYGPRSCVGYRLGHLEAVMSVVMLCRRFVFRVSSAHHPTGEICYKLNLTMAPKDGVWMTAAPR
eukprot:jgi/Ulvmu1/10792/UM069_0026.1